MSGIGLRNWRGEIIQSDVALSDDAANCCLNTATIDSESAISALNISSNGTEQDERSGLDLKERQSVEKKVFRKDEFGRDVEVCVDEKRHKKLKRVKEEDGKKERKHKHNYKKHKRQRDKSNGRVRSPSPRGRLIGTPPPPDPFRPQLDEGRGHRSQRRQHDRNRSRSRSRSRSYRHKERRSREEADPRRGRRDSSWNRSRSRSRKRSRSPLSSKSHRRRSSASVERKWTHSAFNDRNQSPPREPDPLYRPEPEAWVSRAGGVYLPRK